MVTIVIRVTLLISTCWLIESCALLGIFPRERLRLEKKDQIENIERIGFKINGVYIGEHEDGARAFFILFSDGSCYLNRRTTISLDALLYSSALDEEVRFSSQDSPIGWGLYNIENNAIDITFWSVVLSTIEYNRVEWRAEIMNNETVIFEKGWGIDDKTIFNFHPLKNKPDSTNRFIK